MAADAQQDWSVREATTDDLESLARFLDPFVKQRAILPRSTAELETLLRHGFVAEHQAEIIGFAAVEMYSPKLAEVQCLAVSDRFRRLGIGGKLVRMCVGRARALGVKELMAITSSERLFREAGFDYSLPDQKRALFFLTHDPHAD